MIRRLVGLAAEVKCRGLIIHSAGWRQRFCGVAIRGTQSGCVNERLERRPRLAPGHSAVKLTRSIASATNQRLNGARLRIQRDQCDLREGHFGSSVFLRTPFPLLVGLLYA